MPDNTPAPDPVSADTQPSAKSKTDDKKDAKNNQEDEQSDALGNVLPGASKETVQSSGFGMKEISELIEETQAMMNKPAPLGDTSSSPFMNFMKRMFSPFSSYGKAADASQAQKPDTAPTPSPSAENSNLPPTPPPGL